jgi:hypothetical protein
MVFYALHLPGVEEERAGLLRAACKKLKIPFKPLDPVSFDFSAESPVKKGDIVYRLSRGKLLRFFEDYVVRPGCVTFYRDIGSRKPDPFLLEKNGIPVPKTFFPADSDHRQLEAYAKKLGGFPVVLKALGGTRGMGVMKVDSLQSLVSIADFLQQQGKFFIMRKYLPVKTSARFIVLGGRVVASIEYVATDRDFRTNSGKTLKVRAKKYPKELEDLAVRAVATMGWEFGGVDILIHKGKPYVSEVNFPCNFVRAQRVLKRDIALEMVRYLQAKARS